MAAPTIAEVKVGNKAIPAGQPATVAVGQTLTLSGKTVANAIVTLYIYSKERVVKVKADKDGIWKYAITQLPVGDHHVEAQITDPATNQQSAKTSLLAFTIKPAKKVSAVTKPTNSQMNSWGAIITSTIVALLVLAGAFLGWKRYRRRHKAGHPLAVTPAVMTPATSKSVKDVGGSDNASPKPPL